MLNTWKKKMVEKGYNYLDGSIQNMGQFFKTRIWKPAKVWLQKGFQQGPDEQGNILIKIFLKKKFSRNRKWEEILSVSWYVWTQYQSVHHYQNSS